MSKIFVICFDVLNLIYNLSNSYEMKFRIVNNKNIGNRKYWKTDATYEFSETAGNVVQPLEHLLYVKWKVKCY